MTSNTTCPNPFCLGGSVHNNIRKYEGKYQTLTYTCFSCRAEWWASKELKEKLGKPNDPYWDSEKGDIQNKKKKWLVSSIKSDNLRSEDN